MSKKELKELVLQLKDFAPGKPHPLNKGNELYEKGDEQAPLFSEAYLYPAYGKDLARELLAIYYKLEKLAGIK